MGDVVAAAELEVAPDAMVALRALAEPSRSRLVARLAHGEHCVCDLGHGLGLSPALLSHHLKVLRVAGLIRERRGGRWVYYSLDLEALGRLRATLDGLLDPPGLVRAGHLCTDCRDPAPVGGHRA